MSGSYVTPNSANFLQRTDRQLITRILKDKQYDIFNIKDRLLEKNPRKIDFSKHCGTPKFLENQNLAGTCKASDEGIIGIAGIFTWQTS